MAVCEILILSLLSVINTSCQCYEKVTDTGDIYVLYAKHDDFYELEFFSNFHGDYTPFKYGFNLSTLDSAVQLVKSSGSMMTIRKSDEDFYVTRNLASTAYEVRLKKRNCKKLKINRIPKERISKNPYPEK